MLSALQLTYLTCWSISNWVHRKGESWWCKETHFPPQVTVADRLVLVNLYWWNNHLFIVKCAVYSLFSVELYSARHWLLKHRPQWRHQQILYSTVPYHTVVKLRIGIWEKVLMIGVQWFQKNPKPRVHHSVGNSPRLFSHWNGRPSAWDFSVATCHQWWILFISHTRTCPWKR